MGRLWTFDSTYLKTTPCGGGVRKASSFRIEMTHCCADAAGMVLHHRDWLSVGNLHCLHCTTAKAGATAK
jgi:hypothetical protein